MKAPQQPTTPPFDKRLRNLAGFLLLGGGIILYLDQRLQTGWLTLLVLPAVGLTSLLEGLRYRRMPLTVIGGILTGLGICIFFVLSSIITLPVAVRVGAGLVAFAIAWASLIPLSVSRAQYPFWWALLPTGAIGALGACFLLSPLRLLDFVLYLGLGIGLALLAWGLITHLVGLIIPGCLVPTIAAGVFSAWADAPALATNSGYALTQTGTMLVWFAFGWILITIVSRMSHEKLIWWPLIPGGILAMVGWGLYIGGNPGNALSFISNTGSVALIIFGAYLLLLRKGIQR
jgi:hypothetical protein